MIFLFSILCCYLEVFLHFILKFTDLVLSSCYSADDAFQYIFFISPIKIFSFDISCYIFLVSAFIFSCFSFLLLACSFVSLRSLNFLSFSILNYISERLYGVLLVIGAARLPTSPKVLVVFALLFHGYFYILKVLLPYVTLSLFH